MLLIAVLIDDLRTHDMCVTGAFSSKLANSMDRDRWPGSPEDVWDPKLPLVFFFFFGKLAV